MSSQSRKLQRAMRRAAGEKPKRKGKVIKLDAAEQKLDPKTLTIRRRQKQKKEDEGTVYDLIHDRKLNILERDDPKYIIMIADEIGWTRSRLADTIDRIWNNAKKEIENEDRRNAARDNAQVRNRDAEGVPDCDPAGDEDHRLIH